MTNNLKGIKYIYFVGIKGIAMAALAVWAKQAGFSVSGSDVTEEFPSDEVLKKTGIHTLGGFSTDHISGDSLPDLVIYTGAHGGVDNVEVKKALELGVQVLPHGRALGVIMEGYDQISVAGSHGKTTTTAMIASVVKAGGLDPSYAIGCGMVRGLGTPGHKGEGDIFVAEADEYVTDPTHDKTPRFLWQHPEVLVVTNVDFDHPDVYKNLSQVQKAFRTFAEQLKGKKALVVNADDPNSSFLRKMPGAIVVSYGFSPRADYRIRDISYDEEKTVVRLTHKKETIAPIALRVAGRHNGLNAAAAAAVGRSLGISWEAITKGLETFGGTKRRFEKVGVVDGITVYDDYAHHPKEIAATLSAARAWYPKRRIFAVFQPHTFSRTKALLSEFARSFTDADRVYLTDIYGSARETDTLGINGQTLSELTAKHHKEVHYISDYTGLKSALSSVVQSKDIIICMGAGSIYTWSLSLLEDLR